MQSVPITTDIYRIPLLTLFQLYRDCQFCWWRKHVLTLYVPLILGFRFFKLMCLTPFSTIFQLYRGSFIGGNQSNRRKRSTCRVKSKAHKKRLKYLVCKPGERCRLLGASCYMAVSHFIWKPGNSWQDLILPYFLY
jgi:hypothetical protein